MKRSNSKKNSRRGMALMGVMLFTPILLIGLAAYTNRALTEMESTRRLTENVRARYLAHSALNKAFREIMRDRHYRGYGYSDTANYQEGHWDYQIEDKNTDASLENRLRITANGSFYGINHEYVTDRIQVVIKPQLGESVLDYTVAAGGALVMNAGSMIGDPTDFDNDIYAGEQNPGPDKTLQGMGGQQGEAYLYGSAVLVTEVLQSNPPTMPEGTIEYGVKERFFPTYDLDALREKAKNNTQNTSHPGGTYFVGDTYIKDETIKGVVFVEDGYLFIKGDVTVEGCLISAGPLGIRSAGNLIIRAETDDLNDGAPNVSCISHGPDKATFGPSFTIDITGHAFSEGLVQMDSSGTIRGSIISSQYVELGGKAQVYFRKLDAVDLADEVQVPGRWYIEVQAWCEDPEIQREPMPEGPYEYPKDPSGPTGPVDPQA